MGNEQITRSELEALEGAYLITEACAASELPDEDRAVTISWAQAEIARRVKRYMRERAEVPRGTARPAASDDVILAAMRLNAAWLSADVEALRRRGRELRARMTEFEADECTRAAAARAGALLRLIEVNCRSSSGMIGDEGFGRGMGGRRVSDETRVSIVRNVERERFEAQVDGSPAGVSEYRLSSESIVFVHTEIATEFEGHGVGGQLVRTALDFARDEGLAVLPLCPFVAEYIRKHPEYQDLTPS